MHSKKNFTQLPFDPLGDFPILSETINGRRLVYLDYAATTQMPSCVLERIIKHYQHDNANVHRATHTLSSTAGLYGLVR